MVRHLGWLIVGLGTALILVACQLAPPQTPTPTVLLEQGGATMAFQLTSSAFGHGQPIPPQYTCRGKDISPPLSWSDPPAGTQSFALICDDPDAPAGDWVHWLIYNLPATTRSLPEGVPTDGQLPDGSRQGLNGWQQTGYRGPCPPSGTHRYFFKLYALDTTLNLPPRATKQQLLDAMKGHVLAQAELMGTFSKSP
jgi:Raf kinase inhibitor-like YbhB/YbcL family protein